MNHRRRSELRMARESVCVCIGYRERGEGEARRSAVWLLTLKAVWVVGQGDVMSSTMFSLRRNRDGGCLEHSIDSAGSGVSRGGKRYGTAGCLRFMAVGRGRKEGHTYATLVDGDIGKRAGC